MRAQNIKRVISSLSLNRLWLLVVWKVRKVHTKDNGKLTLNLVQHGYVVYSILVSRYRNIVCMNRFRGRFDSSVCYLIIISTTQQCLLLAGGSLFRSAYRQ